MTLEPPPLPDAGPIATTRAAIVATLGLIPDLNPTPAAPQTIVGGSAWPVLTNVDIINRCIVGGSWFVFVAVPGGNNPAQVMAGDTLIDAAVPVLSTVGKVTAAEPWSWPVEAGGATVPVIRFTLEA